MHLAFQHEQQQYDRDPELSTKHNVWSGHAWSCLVLSTVYSVSAQHALNVSNYAPSVMLYPCRTAPRIAVQAFKLSSPNQNQCGRERAVLQALYLVAVPFPLQPYRLAIHVHYKRLSFHVTTAVQLCDKRSRFDPFTGRPF